MYVLPLLPFVGDFLTLSYLWPTARVLSRHGDVFDSERHSCGTEIKAITYSNMQLHEAADRVDLFVIVDI